MASRPDLVDAALAVFDDVRRHWAEHPEVNVAANRRGISCSMAAVLWARPGCLSIRDHVAGIFLADLQRVRSAGEEQPRALPAVAERVEKWGYGLEPAAIYQMLLWRYPDRPPPFPVRGRPLKGGWPRRWELSR